MSDSEKISSIKKCEHCGKWTNGEKAFCEHCGEILDKKYREERDEMEKEQKVGTPLMKWIKMKQSGSSRLWFFVEKLAQSGQLILFLFIVLSIIMLALLPG